MTPTAPAAFPAAFAPTPQQRAIFDFVRDPDAGNLVIEAVAGSGKCLGVGTPVLLFDGSIKPVQEIVAGDLLMGPDSRPRRVLSTTQGTGPLYRITPVKGTPWVCNDVHVLTLVQSVTDEVFDIPLNEYLPARGSRWLSDAKLFRVGVDFPEQPVNVDPYFIGLWLAEGTRGEAEITTPDEQIVAYCHATAARYGCEARVQPQPRNRSVRVRFRIGDRGKAHRSTPHPLRRAVAACLDSTGEKRIPRAYLINDRDTRRELLAGILDGDGHLQANGYDIVTKTTGLRDDILFLARSLGLAAYAAPKDVKLPGWSGPRRYWRISISGQTHTIPCRLPHKQASIRLQRKDARRTGFTAEPIGVGDYFGFTLDGDGRFLLGDFTVTHNTSTIVKAIGHLPPRRRIAFMAFNRAIADELKRKLPGYVTVGTMHSLAFRALRRRFPESAQRSDWLDSKKPNRLIDLLIGQGEISLDDAKRFGPTATKLLGFARQYGVGVLVPDEISVWHGIVDRFEVESSTPAYAQERLPELFRPAFEPDRLALAAQRDPSGLRLATECAVELARRLLTLTVETAKRIIDFDDMLFLPLRFGLPLDRFDWLFVDEAQDTNHVQRALLHKMLAPGGRLVAVGDIFQAIYGFRGADSEALPAIEREFNCTRLPLSVSFRCPRSVIELAQEIVPGIDHRPDAPAGSVVELGTYERHLAVFRPEDLVICRNAAPLVRLAFTLIKERIPCQIRGRDSIGVGVVALIKKVGGRTVDDLLDRLDAYVAAEARRLAERGEEERVGALEDRAEVIRIVAEHLPAGEQRVPALIAHLDSLFSDSNGRLLTLSTIHQAKGLEYDTVYLLDEWLMPSRYAKQDWTIQQEQNLRYVAYTRARQTLVFIETPRKPKDDE